MTHLTNNSGKNCIFTAAFSFKGGKRIKGVITSLHPVKSWNPYFSVPEPYPRHTTSVSIGTELIRSLSGVDPELVRSRSGDHPEIIRRSSGDGTFGTRTVAVILPVISCANTSFPLSLQSILIDILIYGKEKFNG